MVLAVVNCDILLEWCGVAVGVGVGEVLVDESEL